VKPNGAARVTGAYRRRRPGQRRHDRLWDLFLACLAIREVESEADHGDDGQRDDLGELVLQGR
jgi:hypothetical protein